MRSVVGRPVVAVKLRELFCSPMLAEKEFRSLVSLCISICLSAADVCYHLLSSILPHVVNVREATLLLVFDTKISQQIV